jgi:excisionase family DNA binding protein
MSWKELKDLSLDNLLKSEWYKTGEIADMLGVTRQAVITWIKKGWLKAFKVGKSYRVTKEDLEDFLRRANNGK